MKMWIIGAALGIVLSAATASGAFAQAGSTGGTIGKQDKAVSGGQEQTSPSRKNFSAPRQGQGPAAGALAGSWNWTAQCPPRPPPGSS